MRRRQFITLLGGMAAWPLAARAQQPSMPVIGFINAASPQSDARALSAFLKGLSEAGYVDGQNVAIEYRWAEGHNDRLPAMMADLVHREVAVIAATTTPAALAAKAATSTIPIVFRLAGDPVEFQLVQSFDRPGGNITGVTMSLDALMPKKLQLVCELTPSARKIGFLINPKNQNAASHKNHAEQAAETLGFQ